MVVAVVVADKETAVVAAVANGMKDEHPPPMAIGVKDEHPPPMATGMKDEHPPPMANGLKEEHPPPISKGGIRVGSPGLASQCSRSEVTYQIQAGPRRETTVLTNMGMLRLARG